MSHSEADSDQGWGMKWPAPAKLNLMLKIIGQREDGYHLLQTVFQLIDMADYLSFTPVPNNEVCLKKEIKGLKSADDLTVRAANLLKTYTGYQGGVCIDVEKNLPMGGGLGGGSSDAATVLLILNKLWGLGLTEKELMLLGVQLGADVPVFINGFSVWAEGIGENLTEISLPHAWFVVLKPACHVNTGKIFSEKELTRNSKSIKIVDFKAGDITNDCLYVVKKYYKEVSEALNALSVYGEARLTGTGACVFVQFDHEAQAKEAYNALSLQEEVYITQGLALSPLKKQMSEIFTI